jgi:protein-S-isoprenylcysteine O-methyltransferase Ste14
MLNTSQSGPSDSPAPSISTQLTRPIGLLDWMRGLLALLGTAAILFLSAGRLDLPMFWAFWLTISFIGVITVGLVHRKFPDLLRERARPGPGARDPQSRPVMVILIFSQWILAGLDVGRFHWSAHVPVTVQVSALIAVAVGMAGWVWAMYSNRFFSSEVRIQSDRGHFVESGGPYRFVRHPGYFSALLLFVATPFALGSLWAILPTLGALAIFVRRTALEDGMLRAELPGYVEYAQRVRFRVLYGVW